MAVLGVRRVLFEHWEMGFVCLTPAWNKQLITADTELTLLTMGLATIPKTPALFVGRPNRHVHGPRPRKHRHG